MSATTQLITAITAHICADLGIPYDPESADTDPRAQIIANGLLEFADKIDPAQARDLNTHFQLSAVTARMVDSLCEQSSEELLGKGIVLSPDSIKKAQWDAAIAQELAAGGKVDLLQSPGS